MDEPKGAKSLVYAWGNARCVHHPPLSPRAARSTSSSQQESGFGAARLRAASARVARGSACLHRPSCVVWHGVVHTVVLERGYSPPVRGLGWATHAVKWRREG